MFEVEATEEWGGYMGDVSSRELASSVGMGGLAYVPDLSPVGSGAAGTYYPRDTSADAAALNYLGYFPDDLLARHVGTSGSQKADQAAQSGAWDPMFQQAVRDFQIASGLAEDGWIGPGTRGVLAQKVAEKNAKGGSVSPFPVPPVPVPNVIPGPGPQPVAARTDHTGLYIGLGVGAVALIGLGVWAFGD